MGLHFCVYIRDDQLPSRDLWQREIDRQQFGLTLDEFSPRKQAGFVPAQMNGAECGFEYFFGEVDDSAFDDERPAEIGDRSHCVTLITRGGKKLDSSAAEIAAVVLAAMTNGVYEVPGGDFVDGVAALDLLRPQLDET